MNAELQALQALVALLPTIEAIEARRGGNPVGNFETYFPDTGPYRRELYPRHMAFIAAGATYNERMFLAGNRIGKTELGAYEVTAHMTGLYPPWWNGRRFRGPTDWWVAGDTSSTVRDILQRSLLGPFGALGAGMIPAHLIVGPPSRRHGIPDAYESFVVRHVPTGGLSRGQFRSYDQRRKAFQGTAKHGVWLDEEPDEGIYAECLTRTMTVPDGGESTSGLLITTMTPLEGLTLFIKEYLEKAVLWSGDRALQAAEQVWATLSGSDHEVT